MSKTCLTGKTPPGVDFIEQRWRMDQRVELISGSEDGILDGWSLVSNHPRIRPSLLGLLARMSHERGLLKPASQVQGLNSSYV